VEEFLLEILKGVVALIVGLTAGLTVATWTSRRSADLEREKWNADRQLERDRWKADLDLEREKIKAEDERRWHAERRRVYAEFLSIAMAVVHHYSRVAAALELEERGIAGPRIWPEEVDSSGLRGPLEEIRLIGSSRVTTAAIGVDVLVSSYETRLAIMDLPPRSPEKERAVLEAGRKLFSAVHDFTGEARKELGLEPGLKELDDMELEEKAREFFAELDADKDPGDK
jgi:hypothetical protein